MASETTPLDAPLKLSHLYQVSDALNNVIAPNAGVNRVFFTHPLRDDVGEMTLLARFPKLVGCMCTDAQPAMDKAYFISRQSDARIMDMDGYKKIYIEHEDLCIKKQNGRMFAPWYPSLEELRNSPQPFVYPYGLIKPQHITQVCNSLQHAKLSTLTTFNNVVVSSVVDPLHTLFGNDTINVVQRRKVAPVFYVHHNDVVYVVPLIVSIAFPGMDDSAVIEGRPITANDQELLFSSLLPSVLTPHEMRTINVPSLLAAFNKFIAVPDSDFEQKLIAGYVFLHNVDMYMKHLEENTAPKTYREDILENWVQTVLISMIPSDDNADEKSVADRFKNNIGSMKWLRVPAYCSFMEQVSCPAFDLTVFNPVTLKQVVVQRAEPLFTTWLNPDAPRVSQQQTNQEMMEYQIMKFVFTHRSHTLNFYYKLNCQQVIGSIRKQIEETKTFAFLQDSSLQQVLQELFLTEFGEAVFKKTLVDFEDRLCASAGFMGMMMPVSKCTAIFVDIAMSVAQLPIWTRKDLVLYCLYFYCTFSSYLMEKTAGYNKKVLRSAYPNDPANKSPSNKKQKTNPPVNGPTQTADVDESDDEESANEAVELAVDDDTWLLALHTMQTMVCRPDVPVVEGIDSEWWTEDSQADMKVVKYAVPSE